jgi:hypothetical protein
MEVMEQFVQATSRELGEDEGSTRAATAGLLEALRQQVNEDEFTRLMNALPGSATLLASRPAEVLDENQNGLAGALGWIRGWAGGTDRDVAFIAALREAGFSEERVGLFVGAFKRFAAEHAGRERVDRVFAEAPDFEILAQRGRSDRRE